MSQTPPDIPFNTPQEVLDDGMRIFRDLLRIDTTNPPGNEHLIADYAMKSFAEVGIQASRFEAAPGRDSVLAVYGPDNEDTVIFSAHVDVVPANPAHWDHPPFEAVEADG